MMHDKTSGLVLTAARVPVRLTGDAWRTERAHLRVRTGGAMTSSCLLTARPVTWVLLAAVVAVQVGLLFWHRGDSTTTPHEVPVAVQGAPAITQPLAERLERTAGGTCSGPRRPVGVSCG